MPEVPDRWICRYCGGTFLKDEKGKGNCDRLPCRKKRADRKRLKAYLNAVDRAAKRFYRNVKRGVI